MNNLKNLNDEKIIKHLNKTYFKFKSVADQQLSLIKKHEKSKLALKEPAHMYL